MKLMSYPRLFLTVLTLLAMLPVLRAADGPIITEFVAVNDTGLRDEDNETEDWIEIYNNSAAVVNLGGWFLTDNADNLTKWRFPSTNLPPFGYLVVFASDKNRTNGANLHTNFKLDGGGQFLGLIRPDGVTITSQFAPKYPDQSGDISYGLAMSSGPTNSLIAVGASGRVLIPSSDIGAGWRAVAYDDSAWLAALNGVGFDTGTNYDSAIATDLEASMLNVNASAYLRLPFTVNSPTDFQELKLRLRYDDGFVAYLNGQEVLRANAPASPLWNSTATAAHGSDSGNAGSTRADFDTVTNIYVGSQQGAAPAPAVMTANAGSSGKFLRLLYEVNDARNSIAFNQPAPGAFPVITAEFDFRVASGVNNPADGFCFLLIPTATYGTTGAGVPQATLGVYEEPNAAGVFGVAFDVYPRTTQNDVSVHWNGGELQNVTMPDASINLTSGQFHRCKVELVHVAGGANVTVTLTPNINGVPGASFKPINNLFIAGLNPFSNRVQFGGRTGGLNMNVDLDNINVRYGAPSGLVPAEEFNLSTSLSLLQAGANVLAIHGLNLHATNADFLLESELLARALTVDANSALYFAQTTPRSANTSGAAGIADQPQFSVNGGVYTNTVSLAMTSTTPGAVIRYTLDGTAPTTASAIYTTPLDLANSTVVRAQVFAPGYLPGDTQTETYSILANDLVNFTSNLPLVMIDTFGIGIPNSVRVPSSMRFIDTDQGRASLLGQPDSDFRAGIEVRGSSSAGFAKKQYGFEVNHDPLKGDDKSVSILGMPADSDWVLYAPFTDKALMQNFLTYELFEDMGHYSVRRRFVEVFLNGPSPDSGTDSSSGKFSYNDYIGVFILVEKIRVGNERVDIEPMSAADNTEPNISGGYILKKDRLDAPGDYPITLSRGNVVGIVDPIGATLAQKAWVSNWLVSFETALYGNNWTNPITGYAAYIDVDSFVDHHWMVEFAKNIDGYRLSNFFTKDRNGKLKNAPVWDWNLSFGNAYYLEGWATNGWYYPLISEAEHIWLRRLVSGPGAPDFNQRIADRWGELRTNVLSSARILARVDELTALLNESATRNYVRWTILGRYIWPNPCPPPGDGSRSPDSGVPCTNPYYTTFQQEVNFMKNWIAGRAAWIDTQYFMRAPVVSHPGGPVPSGYSISMSAPTGSVYYVLDGTDPRLSGGATNPLATVYSAPIVITNNVRIVARARSAGGVWSPPTIVSLQTETPRLAITEIMYHPSAPPTNSPYTEEDFEYIELQNTGLASINLRNARISGGVEIIFTNRTLAAGEVVVVARNTAAFQSRYSNTPVIAGTFTGQLDNGGDHLVLEGPMREPILDFSYRDDWYPATDGAGFSLVIVDENGPASAWDTKAGWRASGTAGGSPGVIDPVPPALPVVLITEALTHTDTPPPSDTIELHNPGPGNIDIGGWFLTDDFSTPKKYRIADGTTLLAGDYMIFDELAHFGVTNGINVPFSLAANGDEVFLFSGDANTNLTGYVHGFDFGAQRDGVSFGRHVTSVGEEHFVAQTSTTLDAANSGPLVGPVVVSEIMYRPADVFANGAYWNNSVDEYIELQNLTASEIVLSDPAHPTNTWELNQGVEFHFVPGTSIPANGFLLVVNFNPVNNPAQLEAFRSKFGVPPGVSIVGPFQGSLNNSAEGVALYRPDAPLPQPTPLPDEVPDVLVERIKYSDRAPWPAGADGIGLSLQRINPGAYGNDSINWDAAAATPGAGYGGSTPPSILTHPAGQSAVLGTNVTFAVSANGPGPLRYQWRLNHENIPGGTNSLLLLTNVQFTSMGSYEAIVFNNSGSTVSSSATLTVLRPASILAHPVRVALRGSTNAANYGFTTNNATFSVSAFSSLPLRYQWRFNGTELPGATNSSLTVSNVGLAHEGSYDAVVSDDIASVASQSARLSVLINPSFLQVPLSQSVPAGSPYTLSAIIAGNPTPFGYVWRSNSATVAFITSTARTHFITFTSPPTAGSVTMRVILTNEASPNLTVNAVATITTFNDVDRDGLPDPFELALGLATNNAADALGDLDGDGVSNVGEYQAGTNPTNALDYLKIDNITASNSATLKFGTISNRTYTVQFSGTLGDGLWSQLVDVTARSSNRVETIFDPAWTSNRFYRVVTPRQP